jgi:hypothetical protein
MSDPRRPAGDGRLDTVIDDALARTVRRSAPADLRARVTARLSARPVAPRVPALAWAALAAAVVAAVVVLSRATLGPAAPPLRATAATTRPSPPAPFARATIGPQALASPAPAPAPASTAGRLAATPGVEEEPLPAQADRLELARLETPALEIEPLAPLAPRVITPLATQPVVVAPLSLESGDPSASEDKP